MPMANGILKEGRHRLRTRGGRFHQERKVTSAPSRFPVSFPWLPTDVQHPEREVNLRWQEFLEAVAGTGKEALRLQYCSSGVWLA